MNYKNRTILVTFSNLFNTLSNLFLTVGLAWIIIDKDQFGRIQQILMIISFCYSIISGFPTGLSYFYGKYVSTTNRTNLFKKTFFSLFLAAIFLCFIIFLVKDELSLEFKNVSITNNIILILLLLFLRLLGSYFINFFVLIRRESNLMLINFVFLVLNIFLITFLFVYKNYALIEIVLWFLIVIELFRTSSYFILAKRYLFLGNNYLVKKKEFQYILSVTGITILNTFYVFVDKYMIAAMLDPKSYADYQIGAFVVPFIGIITGSAMTTLMPLLSKLKEQGKLNEIRVKLKSTTKYTTLILLPIFSFCLIFGKELIVAIYSDNYELSGEIFQIYTLRYFTAVILFSMTMASIGLQNWVLLSSMFSLVINIVLNYFFILEFGVMGAVYATVITGYLGIFLPIILINRALKCGVSSYFPFKMYLIILFSSIFLAYIIHYLVFEVNTNSNVLVFPISIGFYILNILFFNKLFKIFNTDKLFHKIKFLFNK